ncbi:hypothetical protein [Arenibacter latericius]|uniref:hypothetical protein n=1 Tax=Arenibacter latericius TaxID=86104 RepID=UPI00040E10AA|nr:hypothetical protein [Arenibacter latericius]
MEIRYYRSDQSISIERSKFIGLDTTKLNFRQITEELLDFNDHDKKVVVEFLDGKIKKRVIPYLYGLGYIREKNVLKIKSDSILIDDNYPISELKWILKRHYLNKGEIAYYSESPKRALVLITIDSSKNGKELKEILTKLTRTFDEIKIEIKDTIELRVFFDYLRQMPKYPIPPKPLKIEIAK